MATQGVKTSIVGNILTIEVDLTQDFGDSTSGKTRTVASSGGFVKLDGAHDGISYGLNVCKRKPK